MDTHKRNIVTGIETDHFIILDSENLMSKNEIAKDYPIVQILQSSNKNSYPDIKHIANRIRIASKSDAKEKHLFTIMLNVESEFKIRRSSKRVRK